VPSSDTLVMSRAPSSVIPHGATRGSARAVVQCLGQPRRVTTQLSVSETEEVGVEENAGGPLGALLQEAAG